jgi:hypothetical protein
VHARVSPARCRLEPARRRAGPAPIWRTLPEPVRAPARIRRTLAQSAQAPQPDGRPSARPVAAPADSANVLRDPATPQRDPSTRRSRIGPPRANRVVPAAPKIRLRAFRMLAARRGRARREVRRTPRQVGRSPREVGRSPPRREIVSQKSKLFVRDFDPRVRDCDPRSRNSARSAAIPEDLREKSAGPARERAGAPPAGAGATSPLRTILPRGHRGHRNPRAVLRPRAAMDGQVTGLALPSRRVPLATLAEAPCAPSPSLSPCSWPPSSCPVLPWRPSGSSPAGSPGPTSPPTVGPTRPD